MSNSIIHVSDDEWERRTTYMIEAKKRKETFQQMADALGIPLWAAEKWYHRHVAPKPLLNPRPCMCCRKTFDSEGAHNRLCGSCKSGRGINPFEVITGTSRQVGAR